MTIQLQFLRQSYQDDFKWGSSEALCMRNLSSHMQRSDAKYGIFFLLWNLWDKSDQDGHTNITFMLKVIKAGNK